MISSYFTDEIVVVDVSIDEWGVKTETESSNKSCRLEDYNKLIKDDQGQEVMGQIKILCDLNLDLQFADKIIIKKKNGVAYNQPDKKFIVQKRYTVSMFMGQYLEVVIG